MRAACLAFVAGAWWLQQQAALPSLRVLVGSAAMAVAMGSIAAFLSRRLATRTARVVSVYDSVADRRGVEDRTSVEQRTSAEHPASVVDHPGVAGPPDTAQPVVDPLTGSITKSAAAAIATFATIATIVAAAALGCAWATWRADVRLADALPHALENRDVVVIGEVAVLPAVEPRGTRFEFTVTRVVTRDEHGRPLAIPRHLALGWYRPGHGGVASGAAVPDLKPGERWRLTVRLKRPHGSANPDGFDYEYWLLEEGLRATGYVRPGSDAGDAGTDGETDDGAESSNAASNDASNDASNATSTATRKLADFVWSIGNVVERTRARLRDRVTTVLADGGDIRVNAPYAGVIVALVVGDQRAIPQSDWVVFNRTGIGHLISISGLHVSMLAALGAWIVFWSWRRRPGWCARLPAHKAAALAGTIVALVYCLLAGFGVPAQRTLYMIGVVALALWTGRLSSVSRVLCSALVIVVLIDPWAVTGSGFWLSFAAVASIFYVSAGRVPFDVPGQRWWRRVWPAIRAAARVQWAVTLALTPLTLLFFYQASVVSPLANAIAIPLVSFVVTPLALAGAVLPGFIGAWMLHGAHGLVALLAVFLQWLSGSSIAVWSGAAPSPWAFVAAMVGAAWWLAPRGIRWRWTGALWMLPLFTAPLDRPPPGSVRLTALDIGQGTSVAIETHASDVLYDTGPTYDPDAAKNGTGNDAGNRIIVPFLRARGIDHLHTLVVSHNDDDHSGGALSILASLPVAEVRSSLALTSPIVRASPHHDRCYAGQSWVSDGVRFDLLAPPVDVYVPREGKAAAKPNAHSCVLRVEAAGRVMLLTADIEKRDEGALVERMPALLASDVLLVPHHGSRTSSTDGFLDATHPSLAIVQAGYLNRFAHPRPDVLARYAAHGIPVLRNDRDGAITIVMGPAGIAIDRYRESHRRYWYGR